MSLMSLTRSESASAKTISRTVSGVALCWALAQPALAQETPESWTRDTVVVTGQTERVSAPTAATTTRTSTPIEEIPQSVQVLTRTLIEEQELQTLPGALTNVSGVTPTSTMQTVLMATLIRGFNVNYYFDGMPTYQLPPGIADPATLINVERIEVAKGPTSTLYGGGSGAPLSGLINVVSRDPGIEFGGSVGLRAGSFDTLGIDADLNVPLGESAAFRINGMSEQADSYIDFIDSERYAIFPTLAWDISSDTRLVIRGRYNHLEQKEYAGIPWEIISSIDPNQYAGAGDAPRTEIENKQISAFLTHRFSDTLEANFALSRYDSGYEEWASFPYGQIAGTVYNFGNGYLPSDSKKTFATASLVARLGSEGFTHQLLAGVDFDDTDYFGAMYFNPVWATLDYADADPVAPFGPTPPLFFDQNDRLKTAAAFVQDQIGIGDRLDVTVGLRWTKLDIKSVINDGFFDYATDRTDDKLTPRVGVTYEITDGASLFAGYAEGFQGVVGAGFNGLTSPEPETSQSYEAGAKFAAPIKGLTGTVSLFQIARQNVVTPDPVIPFAYLQTGEQRARGVEMDLVYEPSAALSVLFNYAYTDAEVRKDNALPVGDRLRAVPEHAGRLAARYRFDGALNDFEIGGGLTYTSERELTLPNTLTVGDLVTVDAQASYDFGPAQLSVSIVNLFNEDGFEPYQYFGGAYVVPTQPRSAFITLRNAF
ncbi:MAG: TonB-dependent siderophore receptor [Hyphomonadaceae bacterium]|nr:TonB-dependent siderophore receptor [Hyphomonadaceae bacterium]